MVFLYVILNEVKNLKNKVIGDVPSVCREEKRVVARLQGKGNQMPLLLLLEKEVKKYATGN